MGHHSVRQGECFVSLGLKYGIPADVLWKDPGNKALAEERGNPGVLNPGDRVAIPERREETASCDTETRSRFVRRDARTTLSLRLQWCGTALADTPYDLDVGAPEPISGRTDREGGLEARIPADVDRCTLTLPDMGTKLTLLPGGLDPVTRPTGVQARLNNLGLHCGPVDGLVGPLTRAALKAFQAEADLPVTGEPDAQTQAKLREAHGC